MKLYEVLASGKSFRHKSWPDNEIAIYHRGDIVLETDNKESHLLICGRNHPFAYELSMFAPPFMKLNQLADDDWETP
jgi:hypothetical protein